MRKRLRGATQTVMMTRAKQSPQCPGKGLLRGTTSEEGGRVIVGGGGQGLRKQFACENRSNYFSYLTTILGKLVKQEIKCHICCDRASLVFQ